MVAKINQTNGKSAGVLDKIWPTVSLNTDACLNGFGAVLNEFV